MKTIEKEVVVPEQRYVSTKYACEWPGCDVVESDHDDALYHLGHHIVTDKNRVAAVGYSRFFYAKTHEEAKAIVAFVGYGEESQIIWSEAGWYRCNYGSPNKLEPAMLYVQDTKRQIARLQDDVDAVSKFVDTDPTTKG